MYKFGVVRSRIPKDWDTKLVKGHVNSSSAATVSLRKITRFPKKITRFKTARVKKKIVKDGILLNMSSTVHLSISSSLPVP